MLEQAVPVPRGALGQRFSVVLELQPRGELALIESAEQAAVPGLAEREAGIEALQLGLDPCAMQAEVLADRGELEQRPLLEAAQALGVAVEREHGAGGAIEHHHERLATPEVEIGVPLAQRV